MKYEGPSAKPHDSGIAVGVIIVKNGKVLLGKRKTLVGDGKWGVPGGAVEYQEDPADAARREVLEEVGLKVGKLELFGYTSDVHTNNNLHYITLRFITSDFTGKPVNKEPHKCTELEWFDLSNLPEPMFEPTLEALTRDDIQQKLKELSK